MSPSNIILSNVNVFTSGSARDAHFCYRQAIKLQEPTAGSREFSNTILRTEKPSSLLPIHFSLSVQSMDNLLLLAHQVGLRLLAKYDPEMSKFGNAFAPPFTESSMSPPSIRSLEMGPDDLNSISGTIRYLRLILSTFLGL
jgi:hypothetical protein